MNSQSNDDSEFSQDQYFVSELYLNGNKPRPSKNIDSAVLAMAKQQITVKPLWRRWQYAGSVAASVLIVSFLLMRNQTEITQELTQQDTFMADVSVPRQSNQEKESAIGSIESSNAGNAAQAPIAKSHSLIAEVDPMRNENRFSLDKKEQERINVVAARVSRLKEDKSNYMDSLSKQTEAIFKQVQVAKQKFEELKLRDQAAAQSSRMKIEELSLLQKKRNELKVEQSSESNYENLQNALFEKLLEQKSLSSDWKLSEKYINVLTLEQIRKLRRQ